MKLLEGAGTSLSVELAFTTMRRATTAPSLEDVRRLYVAHAAELRQALARLAPELDADDLLQEVFLIALDRPEALVGADSPRAWLFGIAVKLAATRRRTTRLRRFLGLDEAAELPAVDAPSRTVEQRDAQRAVARALESLSSAKREAFVLFELQGLAGEEVAEALGIPLKTVWTRLFHARKEVTAALERQLLTEARTSGLAREEVRP
ncbi:MAG: RNA polymerase sigma factor [Myxococcota bacterium]